MKLFKGKEAPEVDFHLQTLNLRVWACVWVCMEVMNASGICLLTATTTTKQFPLFGSGIEVRVHSYKVNECIEELSGVCFLSIYHFLTLNLEYMSLLLEVRNEETTSGPAR